MRASCPEVRCGTSSSGRPSIDPVTLVACPAWGHSANVAASSLEDTAARVAQTQESLTESLLEGALSKGGWLRTGHGPIGNRR